MPPADTADSLLAFGGGNTSGAIDAAACLTAKGQRIDFEVETFVAFAQNQRDEVRQVPVAGALAAEPGMKQQTYLAFSACDFGADAQRDITPTLRVGAGAGKMGGGQQMAVLTDWAVRRLTPLECERLQGLPDGYTQVPYRNKPAADGPRYKALGNSMAVNVMRIIGERIAMVDQMEIAA